jgi:D-sedoheptulose 7-phosphate isomerase
MDERWRKQVQEWFLESARVKERLAHEGVDRVLEVATAVVNCLRSGGKILLCGNGGSAAECQHIAGELIGRLGPRRDRKPIPAVALTTDTSVLTALGNDYGFEHIFARQVEALGASNDVLIVVSTSGTSSNIILAVEKARQRGIKTIGLLGASGGALRDLVDLALLIPSESIARIQEAHIAIGHILCELVEAMLFYPRWRGVGQ